jgi:hypothetical protein
MLAASYYKLHCTSCLVCAVICLPFLNGFNQYIGGELDGGCRQDTQELGVFIFAAKRYELFTPASLSAIVSTYIGKH